MNRLLCFLTIGTVALLSACGGDELPSVVVPEDYQYEGNEPSRPQIAADTLYNREAVIPPQCYTKTGGVNNPCYTCHQTYSDTERPNSMADGFLQGDYNFSDLGVHNHWSNLFVDRRDEIGEISDSEIQSYVNTDNYSDFIARLKADEEWSGPIPEIEGLADGADAFDEFGLAKDGSGWVAFNYKPLPSTFWPTNGSTDDVIIRLPEQFRTAVCGEDNQQQSRDVYFTNLALLEMAMKDLESVSTPPINESKVCADLNNDGMLGEVTRVAARSNYVGGAAGQSVERMAYPEGTQFIHTVRYIGFDGDEVVPSKRMKEVRYMKKVKHYSAPELASLYGNERQEKIDGNLPVYSDHGDKGLNNGMGWEVLGFIEDADGELRKQTYQEQMFCMGCHGTIGTTIDQTFAFPRKVTGQGGWGYIDLKGMEDAPNIGEDKGEIARYLERVGGGNEFRENPEMRARWFNDDGTLKLKEIQAADVYALITPSYGRAMALNKAYRVIVEEQSFVYGRDATIVPAQNVFKEVDPEKAPPLDVGKRVDDWDIRLDWQSN